MRFVELEKEFPELFEATYFECEQGWYNLIRDLASELAKNSNIKVLQVKEKFGSLRFYVSGATDADEALIKVAEERSSNICERCGKPGRLRKYNWWKTLCEDCEDARKCTKVL